jgi:hypothetical protein
VDQRYSVVDQIRHHEIGSEPDFLQDGTDPGIILHPLRNSQQAAETNEIEID